MDLLERADCIARLHGCLASAARTGGCTVLVCGEAGVGKTVMLQQFCAGLADIRVLWGACDDLQTPRPFAPLQDVARQTRGTLLTVTGAAEDRNQIFTAALDELEQTPTVLVFEDMHWADEATLDLFKFLGRRIQRSRSIIIASFRDDETPDRHPLRLAIGDLPRNGTQRIDVLPLSEGGVGELARRAGRPADGLYRTTGGNPLFLSEVLAASTAGVPPTVRDAVLARAARLPEASRAIAEFVSVVPGRVEPWLLEQAVHPDAAGIDGCLAIGMIRADDGALSYRHELVRHVIENSLPHRLRITLHATALAILATHPGTPAARLAHHASGAKDTAAVRRYADVAATEAAVVGAHREAVAHLETLLQHSEDLDVVELARVLERLAYECFLTGQYGRASEVRRRALAIWREVGDAAQEGDNLRWLSKLAWFTGDGEEAVSYSVESIRVLAPLPLTRALAEAFCDRAGLYMEAHDNDSAIDFARRAISLAELWNDRRLLSDALGNLGTARLIVGDDTGWADLERGLQLALEGGYQEQIASAYTDLSAMAVSRHRYDEAARLLRAGLQYCDERDLDFLKPYMIAYRARLNFERGAWSAVREDVETVQQHPRATAVMLIPALRTLGHLGIRMGLPDAGGTLEEARRLAGPKPELQRAGTLAVIAAEVAWLEQDYERVIAAARPLYLRASERRDTRMKGELAVWLWRAGGLDEVPPGVGAPYAMEIAGDWSGAARAWATFGCPYEQALVLGLYGGAAEKKESFEILERLGAKPAIQALRRRLQSLGVRGVPRGARPSTKDHPFGLTRREAQILDLVRDGLSNPAIAKRLFVSARTVDHHVSAVLAKLGASTRAEAIEIARRHA